MIEACLVCGSQELRWPSAAEGAVPGETTNNYERVCQRGHRGIPLRFDDAAAWGEFVESKSTA